MEKSGSMGKNINQNIRIQPWQPGGIAEQEQTLSEDEYFVLCDSRSNTDDSRNSAFGMVKKSQIIGKVSFRLKPFSRVTKPEQKTTQTQEEEN